MTSLAIASRSAVADAGPGGLGGGSQRIRDHQAGRAHRGQLAAVFSSISGSRLFRIRLAFNGTRA